MRNVLVATLVALSSAPLFAAAPVVTRYWILDVGVLNPPLSPFKINNSGAMIWNSGNHAFVYRSCLTRDIGSLGGGQTLARNIGPDGSVVGTSLNAAGRWRAFRYASGAMHDLGGGTSSSLILEEATATNFWGDIIGVESVQGGLAPTAVRYQDGGAWPMASIFVPPFGFTRVTDVVDMNDSRVVVGSLTTSSGRTAVISTNLGYQWTTLRGVAGLGSITTPRAVNRYGHVAGVAGNGFVRAFISRNPALDATDLGTLGGQLSMGLGINNYDWVVGWAEATSGGGPRAFVHDGTSMFDLQSLLWNGGGWQLLEATGVNDAGVIVGAGTLNGTRHAFLLLPMPTFPVRPPCQILPPIVIGGLSAATTK